MEKKPSSIFRIDERVFFTMAFLSVICLLVLAFRYNNYEPCESITIKVDAPSGFYVGSNIYFKAQAKGEHSFSWDFGDSMKLDYLSLSPLHAYKEPGWYTVTVKANGRCDEIKNIYIEDKQYKIVADLQPKFYGPATALVNEPVIFRDSTPGATSWEWSFEEIGKVDVTGREATWTYETPGRKEIYLKINGMGDNVGVRTLIVADTQRVQPTGQVNRFKPVKRRRRGLPYIPINDTPTSGAITIPAEEKPAETKHPEITQEAVRSYLMEVIEGRQSAEGFSRQLCGNLKLPVTYNDKVMSFTEMCHQLDKIRKRRVKQLNFIIKQNNGCITEMKVNLKRTWI